uniref:Uncharacterized protein n=1 Tax=viral metagenome TaxID=1070528 RepID=A0A6H1ZZU8_9ZZZZ
MKLKKIRVQNFHKTEQRVEGRYVNSAEAQKELIKKYDLKKGTHLLTFYNWDSHKNDYFDSGLRQI